MTWSAPQVAGAPRGTRFEPTRTFSPTLVAATALVFLLTLSAGIPALAQNGDPPSVESVVSSRPLSGGDTYGPGEAVRVHVRFSDPVVVTGNPRLVLEIGDQPRAADLVSVFQRDLSFSYFVKASDLDEDGISIPANAVRLNRGSIRDADGNDADLTHNAIPDDPERKVNGRLDVVPTITGVSSAGRPVQGDTFGRGELIRAVVRFSEPVGATGTPQLTIQLGAQTRQADFHRRLNNALEFGYVVQSSDVDADGYSVPANAVTLNGGSIKDADGNDADLTHDAIADDPERKVNGASGGVPAVRRVTFSRLPASQGTYVAGESIFAYVSFTQQVRVIGAPQLTVQVGAQTRRADHLPTLRAAQLLLPQVSGFHAPGDESGIYFEYVVQPSDVDEDGVSIPANALTLNGGSIRAVDGDNDASLSHDGLADDSTRKVDGNRGDDQAPKVLSAGIQEQPASGTFGAGDTITARVSLNQGVTITGAPRFALQIGGQTRYATFRERWGTTSLLFDYVVDESDRDDNGLSIAADAVELNGGTIRDAAGNDAELDLGYFAFNDDPKLKVNGQLTPVPALPLGWVLVLLLALLAGGQRRLNRNGSGL